MEQRTKIGKYETPLKGEMLTELVYRLRGPNLGQTSEPGPRTKNIGEDIRRNLLHNLDLEEKNVYCFERSRKYFSRNLFWKFLDKL